MAYLDGMGNARYQAREVAIDAAIGHNIELRLTDRGMTQTQLGQHLGISQATVSRKLRGERPWFATELVIVASVLACQAGDLFGDSTLGQAIGLLAS